MGFCKKCDVDLVLTPQDRIICPSCGQDVCSLAEFKSKAVAAAWAEVKERYGR